MPMRGIERVKRNLDGLTEKIRGPMADNAVRAALEIGAAYSNMLTPIDTSNLVNSQYIEVEENNAGLVGKVGYTAEYAAAVHGAPGKLKGQPRADFGTTKSGVSFGGGTGVGNYWDPDAEPEFLKKGFERDGIQDIRAAIREGMKL